ncbi:MAG: ATP-binding protein [Byssovorax sp.]
MPYIPPRSACFRPDEYKDLKLFADRRDEREELISVLDSYLEPGGPGDVRVLLRGQRGVGKSMLARKVIAELGQRWALLVAEADCAMIGVGPEAVLRALARTLADEAAENALSEEVRRGAEIVSRIASATKVKARDVRSWSQQLKLGISATSKLYDKLAFEFGMTRIVGHSKEIEESFERTVDAAFLQELIATFLGDCARTEQKIVIFVDNLDQAANPERKEDVEQVVDLARFLFGLRAGVVVMTLRTEFVSRDLHKLYSYALEVDPMTPDGLCEVAAERIAQSGTRQRKALEEANFKAVTKTLSGWTGNAWGLLTWLQHLDYAKVDVSGAEAAKLREALFRPIHALFPGLHDKELRDIAAPFAEKPNGFLTREELIKERLSEELIDRAISYHALVPDWLLEAHGYYLPPQLHFLAAD